MINSNNKTITTVIILLCIITIPLYSHSEDKHNSILHEILFGDNYSTDTRIDFEKIHSQASEGR